MIRNLELTLTPQADFGFVSSCGCFVVANLIVSLHLLFLKAVVR
jgi:hypothetical protein